MRGLSFRQSFTGHACSIVARAALAFAVVPMIGGFGQSSAAVVPASAASASHGAVAVPPASPDATQWFLPVHRAPHEGPRAYALVIHGLNLKPSRMNSIVRVLQLAGIETLRLSLQGHDEEGTAVFKQVTRDRWLTQIREAYAEIWQKAEGHPGTPVWGVGYSLGGLLLEDFVNQPQRNPRDELPRNSAGLPLPHFDRFVLFAPALSVRDTSYLVRIFEIFGGSFVVPSFGKLGYRAHDGTPVAAYRALFQSLAHTRASHLSLSHFPTLVITQAEDELVSTAGLHELAAQEHLQEWKFLEVSDSASRLEHKLHHLIIDSDCLGATEWQRVVDALDAPFGV